MDIYLTFYMSVVLALVAVSIYLFFKNRELRMSFEIRLAEAVGSRESEIRKDAISRSGRTLSGKTLERLVPFLERFNHDPHDVKWIGDPVDLVVFDGYSKSDKRNVDKITFVEVKSGSSETTVGQKKIRKAVEDGRVEWEEFRV